MPSRQHLPSNITRLSLLTLSTLLICFALCHDIHCHDWDHITPERAPLSLDCRHILLHMPTIHRPRNAPTGLSTSIPFFPSAMFIHGACIIVVEFLTPMRLGSQIVGGTAVLQSWESVTEATASVITQCVDNNQSGTVSGYLGATGLLYGVLIE